MCLFFGVPIYRQKTVCRCQFLVEFSEPKPGFVYLKVTLWVGSNVGSTKISSRSENFHELRGLRQPSWLFKTGRLENDGRWFSSWQAVKLKQHDCFIASFWQAFFSWRHLFAQRSYYCPTANLFCASQALFSIDEGLWKPYFWGVGFIGRWGWLGHLANLTTSQARKVQEKVVCSVREISYR